MGSEPATVNGHPSVGDCPSCDSQQRAYRISRTQRSVFLPGTTCNVCGHITAELSWVSSSGKYMSVMDADGTVHIADEDGRMVVTVLFSDEDWDAWAKPFAVDRNLLTGAMNAPVPA